MKKILSLILLFAICLSLCACGKSDDCNCDCAQCAQCEKKTQNTVAADADQMDNISEEVEPNENVIEFESPIVVAENEYVRIEVTRFYQEYRSWNGSYPNIADSTVEDATLEKFLVFKYCNKSDQALVVQMDDMYLGSDGASYYSISSPSVEIAEGKNNLGTFLVRTGEKETLSSMEELYLLDGQFYVWSRGEDGALRNQHNLKFSIPTGMDGDSADSASEAASLENSRYLGKWQVTEITFADGNISSRMEEDAALWENYFKGMLGSFENVYFVFTESGDCYYLFQEDTTVSRWEITETGVRTKGTVFVADGDKLVCERDGYLLYWEKVSDSQAIPET